ncbi:MAG: hypothetical protein SOI13_01555 [Bifidobacterium mongoliense]|jgi:Xaa-Pro aminopeptidase|uniref:crAss001_48 related protein n=1 Tax=Bifidobacterium mongoliense TaxID=518643 RepID=UPI002F35CCF7
MGDYKARFITEYRELDDRCNKLMVMLGKYSDGTLYFTPDCPIEMLNDQLEAMLKYKDILEDRALIEDIDLSPDDDKTDARALSDNGSAPAVVAALRNEIRSLKRKVEQMQEAVIAAQSAANAALSAVHDQCTNIVVAPPAAPQPRPWGVTC